MTVPDLTDILTHIHTTPHRMTLDFAGAGVQALAWLHSVGGSSRTVLEATDRYTSASLIEGVGFTPERFTSRRVARALAQNAHARAQHLISEPPLFGVGCTATIATDRTKRGDHRCAVAVQDALGTVTYALTLSKGARDRAGEEMLVSLVILRAVAEACGILYFPELPLLEDERLEQSYTPLPELTKLMDGELDWVALHPDGTVQTGATLPDIALLSGSFNPLHDGHRTLAQVAEERLGTKVFFELPLINADKDPIDLMEARRRALQFAGTAPLLLSRAPLFHQKAALFPDSTFVLGVDTAKRLISPRFHNNDGEKLHAALDDLRQRGSHFLVAGRSGDEGYETLRDLTIPEGYGDLFTELPKDAFHLDISSSMVREGWDAAQAEGSSQH